MAWIIASCTPGPLAREGSTIELQLLVAEYGLLEEQLIVLATALSSSPLALVDDELLDKLAVEVPDLRIRVGVPDVDVYGSNPFSLTKLQLQAKESIGKVRLAYCSTMQWCKQHTHYGTACQANLRLPA